jgi:hypothetical protein
VTFGQVVVDDEEELDDDELPVGHGIQPVELTVMLPPGATDDGDTDTPEGTVVVVVLDGVVVLDEDDEELEELLDDEDDEELDEEEELDDELLLDEDEEELVELLEELVGCIVVDVVDDDELDDELDEEEDDDELLEEELLLDEELDDDELVDEDDEDDDEPLGEYWMSKCFRTSLLTLTLESTDSCSHSLQGWVESHVIVVLLPSFFWKVCVPVPTLNVKSTAVCALSVGAWMKSSSEPLTKGWAMQSPKSPGSIWEEKLKSALPRQRRAWLTPKNVPGLAFSSTWTLTTLPSVAPLSVAGATFPWVASTVAGLQSARVFGSGVPVVSAPPTPCSVSTTAVTATSSSTGPAPARNLRRVVRAATLVLRVTGTSPAPPRTQTHSGTGA